MKQCWFCKESVPDKTVVCASCGRRQRPDHMRSEDKASDEPKEMKRMFCTNCGSPLEEKHKFCWNCGHSRSRGAPVEETVWETCVIKYEGVQKSGWFGPGKARWWAEATGPKGTYRAGESAPWQTGVFDQEIRIPTGPHNHYYAPATAALDALANELVADGWEPTGPYGASYWTKRYRRRIR